MHCWYKLLSGQCQDYPIVVGVFTLTSFFYGVQWTLDLYLYVSVIILLNGIWFNTKFHYNESFMHSWYKLLLGRFQDYPIVGGGCVYSHILFFYGIVNLRLVFINEPILNRIWFNKVSLYWITHALLIHWQGFRIHAKSEASSSEYPVVFIARESTNGILTFGLPLQPEG